MKEIDESVAERHRRKMENRKAVQDAEVAEKTIEKGLLIVNTGPGKGKSTAAFGLALRMLGHQRKVAVVQFIKGAMQTGERELIDKHFADLCEFHTMGEGFTWDTQDRSRDIAVTRTAWEELKRMIADPSYRLVLADELNIVLRYGYLPVEEVVEALRAKPAMTHVVITGRNAPQELIDMADLVTDMASIKHPFRDQNVRAQAGIEF